MASELLMFNEGLDQLAPDALTDHAKKKFSKRSPAASPKEVGDNYVMRSDRELAKSVTRALSSLQDAMDEATRAGLLIEPTFKSISGRFNEFGVSVDSYICTVQMFRKLS